MRKISLVIIAFNEEKQIAYCLESARDIVDDIVVVDSYSTDRTAEIVASYNARFVQHAFEGHIQQKNWAITQAKYPFILSLDADERLSEKLRASILKAKEMDHIDGFSMNRLNFYCGRPIKHCGWYPDKKLRLWDSSKGKWEGRNPHDKYQMQANAKLMHLEGDILHNTYPDKESLVKQVEKFSGITSQYLKEKSWLFLLFKLSFSPSFKFFQSFVLKTGFLEGSTGLFICYQLSREVFLRYQKALMLKRA
jgi:glycosyltransferase involved in cell wall biosynthesis